MSSACPNNVHKVELISIFYNFLSFQQLSDNAVESSPWNPETWWCFFFYLFLTLEIHVYIYMDEKFYFPFSFSSISIFSTTQCSSAVENEDFANANSYFFPLRKIYSTWKVFFKRMECFMLNLLQLFSPLSEDWEKSI